MIYGQKADYSRLEIATDSFTFFSQKERFVSLSLEFEFRVFFDQQNMAECPQALRLTDSFYLFLLKRMRTDTDHKLKVFSHNRLNYAPSHKKICSSPNPDTCKRDLIWTQGLRRWNQVKMRSYYIRVGPNPITYFCKRRVVGEVDTYT